MSLAAKVATPEGLRRLLRMTRLEEYDVFDVLELAPRVIAGFEARQSAEEKERKRREWLERYEPDWQTIEKETAWEENETHKSILSASGEIGLSQVLPSSQNAVAGLETRNSGIID